MVDKSEQSSSERAGKRLGRGLLVALSVCFSLNVSLAATITFGGNITQSTPDGTGPAVNNISLNNILDTQPYVVTLVFPGSIGTPGTYDLTGSSVTFSAPAAPSSETSFASVKLTITANAGFDQFSLLACLNTGSGCGVGNQLDANFSILATMLNSQNAAAIGSDPPHPLDLLEDDGTTDIQASITRYSYTGPASAVPEPSSGLLLGGALACLAAASCARPKRKPVQT